MPMGNSQASIARCIFPTIRSTTRSFISLLAISVFKLTTPTYGQDRSSRLLGPVVSRSGALDRAESALSFFSIRRRSAGCPMKTQEMNQAQHSAWETIQRAHAIANGLYVVVVNRVGQEGKLTFWGQSFVADPFGRIIAKASATKKKCWS